ncbi:MAG: homoserine dehydrogenase, partial [Pseudorhodoplanes sp.]
RMEQEKLSFAECLKDAQRLGYAEADPTFDVEGFDTAQKLAILASIAFGTRVDSDAIHVEGISSIAPADLIAADELGYRIKLLGVAVKTESGIEQRVHPTMVPKDSAIAQVMGVTNAVTVDAEGIAPITLVGPGAGGLATASAVVADIGDIARGARVAPFGRAVKGLIAAGKAPMQLHEGGYYIRLLAVDKPGTAATIATRLAEQHISLESIVQRHLVGPGSGPQGGKDAKTATGPVPVILITYATTEDAVRRALAAVQADNVISGAPQLIRIEKNR